MRWKNSIGMEIPATDLGTAALVLLQGHNFKLVENKSTIKKAWLDVTLKFNVNVLTGYKNNETYMKFYSHFI